MATTNESLKPWIEKYRPRTIDDVAAQEHTIRVLKKQLGNANVGDVSDNTVGILTSSNIASAYAVLRATRHRKNIHHSRIIEAVVWVRYEVT